MEKTIEIIMNEDKSIDIKLNGISKKSIPVEDRSLNAKEIYESLEYKKDDTYVISSHNESQKDPEVFKSIVKLYEGIIIETNSLSQDPTLSECENQSE